jgi:hypothetical protein
MTPNENPADFFLDVIAGQARNYVVPRCSALQFVALCCNVLHCAAACATCRTSGCKRQVERQEDSQFKPADLFAMWATFDNERSRKRLGWADVLHESLRPCCDTPSATQGTPPPEAAAHTCRPALPYTDPSSAAAHFMQGAARSGSQRGRDIGERDATDLHVPIARHPWDLYRSIPPVLPHMVGASIGAGCDRAATRGERTAPFAAASGRPAGAQPTQASKATLVTPANRANLHDLFNRFDTDAKGYITRKELCARLLFPLPMTAQPRARTHERTQTLTGARTHTP